MSLLFRFQIGKSNYPVFIQLRTHQNEVKLFRRFTASKLVNPVLNLCFENINAYYKVIFIVKPNPVMLNFYTSNCVADLSFKFRARQVFMLKPTNWICGRCRFRHLG